MKSKSNQSGLKSLGTLRTAVSARVRSKPSAEGQRFLDLYSLQRERLRWTRMKRKSEQQIHDIERALQKLGFPLELIAPEAAAEAAEAAEAAKAANRPVGGPSIRFRKSNAKRRSA